MNSYTMQSVQTRFFKLGLLRKVLALTLFATLNCLYISAQENEAAQTPRVVILGVKPNARGLERIQESRVAQGISPANIQAAGPNEELVLGLEGQEQVATFQNAPEALDLPICVDNRNYSFSTTSITQPALVLGLGDDTQNLQLIKQMLNNGHVLYMGTCMNSWVLDSVKANPNAASNPHAGELAAVWQNGNEGQCAVVIVGYDDSIWIDVNNNDYVDSGELGALLITGSDENTFVWVSYDAFLATSAVVDGPDVNRTPFAGASNSFAVALINCDHNENPLSGYPVQEPAVVETPEQVVSVEPVIVMTPEPVIVPTVPAPVIEPVVIKTPEPIIVPAEPTIVEPIATVVPTQPVNVVPFFVSILSPTDGEQVKGVISIQANVSHSTGVNSVKFYIDGQLVSTVKAQPYEFSAETSQWTKGGHKITVETSNTAGETASASVEVFRKRHPRP